MDRHKFLQRTVAGTVLALSGIPTGKAVSRQGIEFSLAEWSLHRTIWEGKLDHLDFPARAREFGISAVEYVNGLF